MVYLHLVVINDEKKYYSTHITHHLSLLRGEQLKMPAHF